MKSNDTATGPKFTKTRHAIAKIKHDSIRDDFRNMIDGLEFCLAKRRKRLAAKCANALVGMAIGLNRTITPGVAVGIVLGLLQDADGLAEMQGGGGLGLGYIEYHFDEACMHQECVESEGGVCITIEGAGGCGNRMGFQFPWVLEP